MFLNCHTAFSFKYGTLMVKALIDEARRCGVHKLVLTEINNTASYLEMMRQCYKNLPANGNLTRFGKEAYVLEIAVGVEFRKDHELLYIGIAENNQGFENLNRFLSFHNREGKTLPPHAPPLDDVFFIYPQGRKEPARLLAREFIGVRRHELPAFARSDAYADFPDKFVILHPVTFATKIDFNIHRLLRAIDNNTLLSKLPEHQQARADEVMMPERDIEAIFASYPGMIRNTRALMDRCSLACTPADDKNKQSLLGNTADHAWLESETWRGYHKRYAHKDTPELRERVQRELTIIRSKKFDAYYLITYDLVQFARHKGFDFVGRGSGANSTVAYCLGITNVDPVELDLYFERFLNEERATPPDFDIDFAWDNRDDVYSYLFDRYGRDHVCLLGTHVTYQERSVIRELGKVFGLPKEEIDQLVEEPARFRDRDHITELIFKYARWMKDLPANISIHAGGVLITEKPIYAYTATELPPKGLPVSHFEMHNAEDFGIYKFDILSQRGLGHLKETVKHVRRNQGVAVDIHRFADFKTDEKIKDLMRNSKAMGCFYVESPAMRMLLGKLRCDDYLTLVAASSIIRPGVASSGMMRAYIERFHTVRQGGTYDVIHPRMHELMKDTFGVMVYQEDVIKVAHYFAGLTLTESDVLRRGMSGKYRSREEFQGVRERFFQSCRERGYEEAVIDRVWYEIESFSGYSFAKGHSASYAVESYQSLFLKAHYPLEFMVGVINNFGGFYSTEFYVHEARMNGGIIQAPCVNRSEHLTTIYGREIYLGFVHLKSLESKVAQEIPRERQRNGEFTSFDNFLRRIAPGLEQVRILIRLGAFRFTGKSKQHLLWEAMLFYSQARKREQASAQLFDAGPQEFPLPALHRNELDDAFDEIELLGFPLCDPYRLLAAPPNDTIAARQLTANVGAQVHITGYVITTKNTSTLKGESMHFGTFYDQRGEVFDTVHFPDVARKFPFRGRGFYALKGKVVEDFGVAMIEVTWMDKLSMVHKRPELAMQ